ncbi:aldehyde dehydrogenase [Candidatus Merdisoma sp. HCP28S3_D10]|uniref:aldehyde dehydrogenase n=1 Tax=unclassified Candidatus Merdisoma TaxID=3099611 RepID=UPI003F8BA294
MNEQEIQKLIARQRRCFRSGFTLSLKNRVAALTRLERLVTEHETELQDALRLDLGKSAAESYMCETGLLLNEIRYLRRHLPLWMRDRLVPTPLAQFCSRSYQKPSPYGVTLIMSPWNYPLLLTLEPLADALAAGNTAVLKPSAYSVHTSRLLERLIRAYFPAALVAVVTGGRAENEALLEQHFDYIFFTGSKSVGRLVMEKASAHLTPVTLELGGKSPCIVDQTADLPTAARRIVFGKFLNCGQTCVAPDYILCDIRVKNRLIEELIRQIRLQFGERPLENETYSHIINEKHFLRLLNLMNPAKTVFGGRSDADALKIEPTLLDRVTWRDDVMQEEIFGPILPILTYTSIEEAIRTVNERPHPLALYLFTRNRRTADRILTRCSFGGGCVNDTIIHLATPYMGFGGFGESGMGSYHGKAGFETFSHFKSIVDKKNRPDLPMRYQPYSEGKRRLVKLFLR